MGIPKDGSPVTFEKDPERAAPAALIGYCYGFYVKCPPSARTVGPQLVLYGMLWDLERLESGWKKYGNGYRL